MNINRCLEALAKPLLLLALALGACALLQQCRNKCDSLPLAKFATKAESIGTGRDAGAFRLTVSNPLPHAVELRPCGFKVRSIAPPRICTSKGAPVRSFNHDEIAGMPARLSLPARASVSFACKLPLTRDEQAAFRSGRIRIEYPVLSYAIGNMRHDAQPPQWLPFSYSPECAGAE